MTIRKSIPIRPNQIPIMSKHDTVPDGVIDAFNRLLIEKSQMSRFESRMITLDEVIQNMWENSYKDADFWSKEGMIDAGWFDIVGLYALVGWVVSYFPVKSEKNDPGKTYWVFQTPQEYGINVN